MTAVAGRGGIASAARVAERVGAVVTPGRAISGAVAASILALSLGAKGGIALAANTRADVLLIVGGTALAVLALALPNQHAPRRRLHGAFALGAVGLLVAYTAASITWSLDPGTSWQEANRTLSYGAAFVAGLALVRLRPHDWAAAVRGVALGATLVCVCALAAKVLPGQFAADEQFARLRAPFGYWNATGLMAAMAVPPLLWLAARRSGHAAVNALAFPALGLALVTLLEAYSRGGLIVLAIALIAWFSLVPLRLRSAVALVTAAIPAGLVVAWSFSQPGLTEDLQPLTERVSAGLQFGLLLSLMFVVLLAAGLAIGYASAQFPPTERSRRRAGRTIVGVLVAAVAAGVIALAAAPGGIGGQVSSAFDSLTSVSARTPDNAPGRLTAVSSVRARYWDEALKVHQLSPLVGTGAGAFGQVRTRYRTSDIEVRDAHGYVVQTLADLGWLGLAVSLLALAAWVAAAVRTLGLRRRDRGQPWDAERVAVAALASVVLLFGAHSLVDWTWFVPGTAALALFCAGWVAGRGPLRTRLAEEGPTGMVAAAERVGMVPATPRFDWRARAADWRPAPVAVALALVVAVAGGATAWAVVQPLRSANASDVALARLDAGQPALALSIARIATRRDPLSTEPLFTLAAIQATLGDRAAAERTLIDAIRRNPTDPEAWRRLGRLILEEPARARDALRPFQTAYFLDPESAASQSDLVKLARAIGLIDQQEAAARAAAEAAEQQQQEGRRTP